MKDTASEVIIKLMKQTMNTTFAYDIQISYEREYKLYSFSLRKETSFLKEKRSR
jgi:hypothetical protein